MFQIYDISKCEKLNLSTTGARKKDWYRARDRTILFKESKNENTYEHVVEKIVYEVAKILHIPHARTELAMYNGKLGSISFSVLDGLCECELLEFKELVKDKYGYYSSSDRTWYADHSVTYNTDLVIKTVPKNTWENFIMSMFYDFLIVNSDRHHSNWGVIYDVVEGTYDFCPLYDSGSGLFSTVSESTVEKMLKKHGLKDYILGAESMVRYRKQKNTNFGSLLNNLKREHATMYADFSDRLRLLTDDRIEIILQDAKTFVSAQRLELFYKLLYTSRSLLLDTVSKSGELNLF